MNNKLTEITERRYDRRARFYDLMEAGMEKLRFAAWRKLQWSKITGGEVLEVGVGTGKNLDYYPRSGRVTAIDLSNEMLARAKKKAGALAKSPRLVKMDVQQLKFRDNSFDTVAATFVFCSVPDPVLGLKEVARVCRPGGKVVLLEHVLSDNSLLGWLMNTVNPLVVRLMGANINRRTVENVRASGLVIDRVRRFGIVRLIEATKEQSKQ